MIEINVITESRELIKYLKFIGEQDENLVEIFKFADYEFMVEHLADFLYLELKNELIYEMTNSSTEEGFIKEFYDGVPISTKKEVKYGITEIIKDTLNERGFIFEYEAIKKFRARKIREEFREVLEKQMEVHLKNSKYNNEISTLKTYINENSGELNSHQKITIKTFESGKIGIFCSANELITLESAEEQENIVIFSIMCAPKNLIVEDEFELLSRETVIILNQLFEDKISFS